MLTAESKDEVAIAKGQTTPLKKMAFSGIDEGIKLPAGREWKLFQVRDHLAKTCILNKYYGSYKFQ